MDCLRQYLGMVVLSEYFKVHNESFYSVHVAKIKKRRKKKKKKKS